MTRTCSHIHHIPHSCAHVHTRIDFSYTTQRLLASLFPLLGAEATPVPLSWSRAASCVASAVLRSAMKVARSTVGDSTLDIPGILVTATSGNHFPQLHGLVHGAQQYLPQTWRITVYDLIGDLKAADVQQMKRWCGVEYRRFNESQVIGPWFRKYLTLSIWKPYIIGDALGELPEGGIVLYADTSTRLQEPLTPALLESVQLEGFVGRKTASPISMYTHPRMAFELSKPSAQNAADALSRYTSAPMVCGCLSLWANTPFVRERLLSPWKDCVSRRECILPEGADGQDNGIGLRTSCRPGIAGHCHRGDQSALSILLYDVFNATTSYLRNTTVGPESWRKCEAVLYGTRITTERSSRHSAPVTLQNDSACFRKAPVMQHSTKDIVPSVPADQCNGLILTRVAVPTGIQPIFPGMGGPGASLKRLLQPCLTKGSCQYGNVGCFRTKPKAAAIGRCNSTHAVEYEHRLPDDGEPAIISFFAPSQTSVREALAAVSNARPRLLFDFEPPVHSRMPVAQVLAGVDGWMTYTRQSMVRYPYFSAGELWAAARSPVGDQGFDVRLPAIAMFVTNCKGHRAEAIEWLRKRFDVHSFGSCKHNVNASVVGSERRQKVEAGHFPECTRFRAVLAIENNACEDYVSEKLLEAVRCGAVPIVRTVKGLPDYQALLGNLPLLDAANLDEDFERRLRQVLTQRDVWESYMPSIRSDLIPSDQAVRRLDRPNPHCQMIEVAAQYRSTDVVQSADKPQPIHCATWYKLVTPHGMQWLPRRRNYTTTVPL